MKLWRHFSIDKGKFEMRTFLLQCATFSLFYSLDCDVSSRRFTSFNRKRDFFYGRYWGIKTRAAAYLAIWCASHLNNATLMNTKLVNLFEYFLIFDAINYDSFQFWKPRLTLNVSLTFNEFMINDFNLIVATIELHLLSVKIPDKIIF